MATAKNLCSRSDGLDNLGKSGKAWNNVYAKNIYATSALSVGGTNIANTYLTKTDAGNTYLTTVDAHYLQRNKAYSAGDIAYSPNLPSYLYLECLTAGTTGSTEPDWTSATMGG